MNKETLTILQEECAEVIVEVSKILRFDNDSSRLEEEIGDVLCMINLLLEQKAINVSNVTRHADKKREKLKKWSSIEGL